MWARIDDGRVIELTGTDPAGRYHEDLIWMPVPGVLRPWVSLRYVVTADGVAPPTLPDFKAQLKAALADKRWQEEAKGALVGPHRFHTDTASQSKMTSGVVMGQILEATNGPDTYSVQWKAVTGWVVLNLAGMINTALACGAHVQQAFTREAAIAAEIDAAPDWQAALLSYSSNINDGWPA